MPWKRIISSFYRNTTVLRLFSSHLVICNAWFWSKCGKCTIRRNPICGACCAKEEGSLDNVNGWNMEEIFRLLPMIRVGGMGKKEANTSEEGKILQHSLCLSKDDKQFGKELACLPLCKAVARCWLARTACPRTSCIKILPVKGEQRKWMSLLSWGD